VTGGYYTVPDLYTDAGYRDGLLVAAGAGILGLAVALAMRHGRAPATGGEVSG